MKIFYKTLFLIIYIPFLFCNNKNSNSDHIKELEQKNRELEMEIERNRTKNDDNRVNSPNINNNQNYNSNFFTIGSSESEVIKVMGEPSSVLNLKSINTKVLNFKFSSVTFKNGRVESYDNQSNNLRVRYNNEGNDKNSTNDSKKDKDVKYVYYSGYIMASGQLDLYYSQIYTIENYTSDKVIEIQNCLIEKIKFYTQSDEKVFLVSLKFNSLSAASDKWTNENGKRIFGDGGCFLPKVF